MLTLHPDLSKYGISRMTQACWSKNVGSALEQELFKNKSLYKNHYYDLSTAKVKGKSLNERAHVAR